MGLVSCSWIGNPGLVWEKPKLRKVPTVIKNFDKKIFFIDFQLIMIFLASPYLPPAGRCQSQKAFE